MLLALAVSNFTVVKHLSLNLSKGFSAITGETGAGKSIILDALSLCIGERADPSKVRRGETQAQISATFDIAQLPLAKNYLSDMGFQGEDTDECVIRRIVNTNGRSRAFINGHPATLNDLQTLGDFLAIICGQHAQYALLKSTEQRNLLDRYAQHTTLLNDMSQAYHHYQSLKEQYQVLLKNKEQQEEKRQLLRYQLEELEALAPEADEFQTLEAEHKKLSYGQETQTGALNCVYALKDREEGDILSQLRAVQRQLESLTENDPQLAGIVENIQAAIIELEEGANDIQHYADSIDLDPEHINLIENRYSAFVDAARKHRVQPHELAEHFLTLSEELQQLEENDASLEAISKELNEAIKDVREARDVLSQSRQAASNKLSQEIKDGLPSLGMENGDFVVSVISSEDHDHISEHGADQVELQVQTNPGELLGPLSKIASGGELSRISLLLQLAIAKKQTTPTLIFDEVDTGISGPTAAVVGALLQQLGEKTQVFSITHLPQVACHAHQQFFVSKKDVDKRIETSMTLLDERGRELEIARLLGASQTQDAAIKNAQALLSNARQNK